MEKKEITINGKYAEQRKNVLENHAPTMYEAMIADGSLETHLADVQEMVSSYVEKQVERYKTSEEYLAAEQKDSLKAMRLLNMAVLEAEDSAYRIWIANIPESDEDEDDEYDDFDD
ncbi:MAG: TnpV protein [Oscillospiraceae bacterium]|nr:TnpV protein [Oscillospiraceae bacterium]